MVGPYRDLFRTPGVKGFVVTGFLGRMPMSMLGIGIVLLISAVTGSYATAGALSGVVSVAFAVAAPLSGRLVDMFGQARVLIPLALVHGAALAALMLLVHAEAATWTLFAAGVIAGAAAPSLGSMVRARWSHLLGGSGRLHTAFSFESVADEVIFVSGPTVVTGLATMVNPYAGLLLALVLGVGGTIAFALQRRTEPPVRRGAGTRHRGSPILIPGVALLAAVFLAIGSVFGSTDVITVAYAEAHGAKGAAGPMLAAFSGGSLVSGLWFGGAALAHPAAHPVPAGAAGVRGRAHPDACWCAATWRWRSRCSAPGCHLPHADHRLRAGRADGPAATCSPRAWRGSPPPRLRRRGRLLGGRPAHRPVRPGERLRLLVPLRPGRRGDRVAGSRCCAPPTMAQRSVLPTRTGEERS